MQNGLFFFFFFWNSFSDCLLHTDGYGAMAYVETWIHGTSFFSVITLEMYWFHFVIIINVNLICSF